MSKILFEHVALIGLGQMGASLALAMKRGGLVGDIIGYDVDTMHAKEALEVGAIDRFAESLEEDVAQADLVILCTPVGSYGPLMKRICEHLKEDTTLTDIGSIKAQAIRDIIPHLPQHVRLIPSHPIAGSEKTGPYNARADFFEQHLFLITPIDGTPPEWVEPVAKLWHSLGAAVDLLTPDLHDQIYAYMSHLPQLLAFAAMPVLAGQPLVLREEDELFRRFIRIGRSDPKMWHDVFMENDSHVLAASKNMLAILEHMRDELLLGSANDKKDALEVPVERICKLLWPRLLSSAMIAAVQLVEEQLKMKLARYAAGGFTDVACPVMESTDDDFSAISDHPGYVIQLIEHYVQQQKKIIEAIEAKDSPALMTLLQNCQSAGIALLED